MSRREIFRAATSPAIAICVAIVAAAPARAQFPDVLSETECPGCRAALQRASSQPAELASRFAGTWSSALTSADDPAWRAEDFSCFIACTPAARARAAAGDALRSDRDGFEPYRFACDPNGLAEQVVSPLPLRIEPSQDHVVLRYEEFGALRTIPLGPAPAAARPSLLGVSTARLDGDALVIETSGIAAHRFYGWFGGKPHSDRLRAIERYTTSADGAWLDLSLELDDPATLSEPLVLTKRWRRVPGAEIARYGCDVMSGQLGGVFAEYVDPKIVEQRTLAASSPTPTSSSDRPRADGPPSRRAR